MRSLISILDLSSDEIREIFAQAARLKAERKRWEKLLRGKTLGLLFDKPSLRTRVSFEVGMHQLGGYTLYLGPHEVGLGKRESVKDIARTLSRYLDCLVARVFDHTTIVELAREADIPVINGLSNLFHPCQILSDLFTIMEKREKKLKDIKIAFIGDGSSNMANSWLCAAAQFKINLAIATPQRYEPNAAVLLKTREAGGKSFLRNVCVLRDPVEAVKEADVIYTDTWVSMGQDEERKERKRAFRRFQVNEELLQSAKPDVMVMHCLPLHRGEEITDTVIESPQSIIFDQVENRLHLQKAILLFLLDKKTY
ncbi:ornithine carbamoyltransferase [candidate division NPL-UPA2 bacterium Unc8]|uniref:Ornithine carbamoyltransferase n=1 Tax=candidate division NPL-UPA2 bacterium Unc8 TaxID=1980939 RepID=A0A399FY20_UNCN2|nr:Ornithine carbamoyltransferase [Bacillota bacterium]MBT9137756.1 Ornithine carbamoyltransferase [Bacillota bacterium]MBT9146306.1 Ornithine carbamoyltransferase [Bacillota bacterium]RII00270.1 MAG: ornithine carbamoyltransferase [candidate division NPL-UPA2 bacterium Unc8]